MDTIRSDSNWDISDISSLHPEDGFGSYFSKASDSLNTLLNYPFLEQEMEGKADTNFNNIERINVIKDKGSRIVRCPIKFLEVVKYIEDNRNQMPKIGLKYKDGSVKNYVHLINDTSNGHEGWVFIDNNRSLQVRKIHKIERIIDYTGLYKINIIANQIGLPARNEVSRITFERGDIIELHHFDTIQNHNLAEYF